MPFVRPGHAEGAARAAALAARPAAPRWARLCGWVPGTGYCRSRDCGEACVFRAQRAAEAGRVTRWRRLRRFLAVRS